MSKLNRDISEWISSHLTCILICGDLLIKYPLSVVQIKHYL